MHINETKTAETRMEYNKKCECIAVGKHAFINGSFAVCVQYSKDWSSNKLFFNIV